MRAGGQDVFHRRELLGDKARNLAHGAVLDDDRQIEAARHQVNAFYLMMGIDLAGDLVEAHAFFRRNFDLNQCSDAFLGGLVPVDNGFITKNGIVFFKGADRVNDLCFGRACHGGKLRRRQACVLAEQIQQFFRVFHDNALLFQIKIGFIIAPIRRLVHCVYTAQGGKAGQTAGTRRGAAGQGKMIAPPAADYNILRHTRDKSAKYCCGNR